MKNAAPEKSGFSSGRLNRITEGLRPYIDGGKIAGMVASVARRGNTVYRENLGWASMEDLRPMGLDSIFRIRSMTKPVTAVAAMTLYEEGHFTLNTPVAEFLPEFAHPVIAHTGEAARPITFRHLFTHTAGFTTATTADEKTETLAGFVATLAREPLQAQPGSKFSYGFSTHVLGRVVEVISGKSIDRFFEERIFAPLGMTDTGFHVPESKAHRLTAVYAPAPDAPIADARLRLVESPKQSPLLEKPALLSPGGGLVSTERDYGRFLQMLVNGGNLGKERILSPTTVDLFTINQAPPEALPFGIAPGEDVFHKGYGFSLGTRVLMDVAASGQAGSVGEFGWDGYLCTHCWVDRKRELYGMILTQLDPFNYYPLATKFKQLVYQAMVD